MNNCGQQKTIYGNDSTFSFYSTLTQSTLNYLKWFFIIFIHHRFIIVAYDICLWFIYIYLLYNIPYQFNNAMANGHKSFFSGKVMS